MTLPPAALSTLPIPTPPPPPTRTMRTRIMTSSSKPKQLFNLHTYSPFVPLPCNLAKALNTLVWNSATTDKFNALIANNTWELVPPRPNMNIIQSMWIFKHKTKSDGSLECYKARLVFDYRSQ